MVKEDIIYMFASLQYSLFIITHTYKMVPVKVVFFLVLDNINIIVVVLGISLQN